ncbi:MAG: Phospholipase/Carboxylesterase [Chthonomonadales bacterium]|nr:Phospholipase/Carboxylesterase [Chthonomonadales bacterium]
MKMRGMVLFLAAMALFGGIRSGRAQVNDPLPTDPAGMTEQLITNAQSSFRTNVALAKTRPDETFAIVRDHWKDLKTADAKRSLLFAIMRSDNPHVLDILDIGTKDNDTDTQLLAFQLLQNFSYRNFLKGPASYQTWRDEIAGKPLAKVVESGCIAFTKQFLQASDAQRTPFLNVVASLDFYEESELAKVRRKAALDAGLPIGLAKVVATPPVTGLDVSYIQLCCQVLRSLKPDEAFIKKSIAPLTDTKFPPYVRRDAALLLGTVNSAWAADRLFEMLCERTSMVERGIFMSNLGNSSNPYLIPKMIGVLENTESQQEKRPLVSALSRLTKASPFPVQDGASWHAWWNSNKSRYSQEVQAIPIPKVRMPPALDAQPFFLRRHVEQHQIGPNRAYWLLSPAFVGQPAAQNTTAPPLPKPTFGLIIVLADGAGGEKTLTDFWQEAIQKSLKDGYFVAVPIAPRWNASQPSAWLTQQNVAEVKEARFTTESFMNDIAADVASDNPINKDRIFLHGVGEGGLAAYACSLSAATPFRGFYLLSAPFKTAQLPPLTNARGRRYFIQQSKDEKITPYFQAAAADELLRKQNAVVHLISTQGEHGYKFADSPWEQIAQAIAWLEAPH